MLWLQNIFPGFTIFLGLALVLMALFQLKIYRTAGHKRTLTTAMFCITSAIICFFQFTVQSRLFSSETVLIAGLYVIFHTGISRYFYINSLSYYIAIPNKVYRTYTLSNALIGTAAFLPLLSYLLGGPNLFAVAGQGISHGNYFADSFSLQVGRPGPYPSIVVSAFAFFDLTTAIILLVKVYNSSRDVWFMLGLFSTIVASLVECILLPWTIKYYVPMYFMANFFEAARMSFLSAKEHILEQAPRSNVKSLTMPVKNDKYQNTKLNDERINELCSSIKVLFEEKKIFTNPDLHLNDIAVELGVPNYHISQALNNGFGKTFFDLVSDYRVAAVKQDFANPKQNKVTILEIAYKNGFNSKSSFNRSFKKLTGQTPSSYRRSPS